MIDKILSVNKLHISLIITIFVIDERDIETIITNSGNPSRTKINLL